jgi:pimeloyl-ACP methyl ester carboxylesterase
MIVRCTAPQPAGDRASGGSRCLYLAGNRPQPHLAANIEVGKESTAVKGVARQTRRLKDIPALADAGLRCVLYDRRGHGRSDRPASGRVLLKTLLLNTNVNMAGELQKIQVPVLVLHGDQDASAPIQLTGRKTADLLSDATLRVYPGAGHGLYASDHQAVNADILAFIRGRLRPPGHL